ncbi:hypothetical protein ACIBI4_04745 [Streptomyces sp. NPDC050418]|uniref:hypothetical protein n=1 Tax=Streptomyces sp. NPDC050418 TaxID=3365612 RepID=UPI00379A88AE
MSDKAMTKTRRRRRLRRSGRLGSAPTRRRASRENPALRAARRARDIRRNGLVALPIGIALLTAGFVLLLGVLPGMVADEHDFKSAVPCADPDPRVRQDCLQDAQFTVEGTRIQDGRNAVYWVDLSGPGPGSGRVVLDGAAKPLLRALSPGDGLRATVWRGHVVAVHKGDSSWATHDDPRGEPLLFATVGGAALIAGAFTLFAGTWCVLRPSTCVPRNAPQLVTATWLTVALLAELVAAAFVQARVAGASLWLLAGVWCVVALMTLLGAAVIRRRSTRTAGDQMMKRQAAARVRVLGR